MYPDIFEVLSADTSVAALLGSGSECRVYPFGIAPEKVAKPYVTWQTINGGPENYLQGSPDIDNFTLQIDCWGVSVASVRNVANAIQIALQSQAYVTTLRGDSRDPVTLSYRQGFDVSWFKPRG